MTSPAAAYTSHIEIGLLPNDGNGTLNYLAVITGTSTRGGNSDAPRWRQRAKRDARAIAVRCARALMKTGFGSLPSECQRQDVKVDWGSYQMRYQGRVIRRTNRSLSEAARNGAVAACGASQGTKTASIYAHRSYKHRGDGEAGPEREVLDRVEVDCRGKRFLNRRWFCGQYAAKAYRDEQYLHNSGCQSNAPASHAQHFNWCMGQLKRDGVRNHETSRSRHRASCKPFKRRSPVADTLTLAGGVSTSKNPIRSDRANDGLHCRNLCAMNSFCAAFEYTFAGANRGWQCHQYDSSNVALAPSPRDDEVSGVVYPSRIGGRQPMPNELPPGASAWSHFSRKHRQKLDDAQRLRILTRVKDVQQCQMLCVADGRCYGARYDSNGKVCTTYGYSRLASDSRQPGHVQVYERKRKRPSFPPPPFGQRPGGGGGGQACPFVYVERETKSGAVRFVKHTEIIKNLVGAAAETTQVENVGTLRIDDGTIRLLLSEEKPEISLVDHVALRVDGVLIRPQPLDAFAADLRHLDGVYATMRPGEQRLLVFRHPSLRGRSMADDVELVSHGYYDQL